MLTGLAVSCARVCRSSIGSTRAAANSVESGDMLASRGVNAPAPLDGAQLTRPREPKPGLLPPCRCRGDDPPTSKLVKEEQGKKIYN